VPKTGGIIETSVIAISGSLRRKSYNTALLRHAARVAPVGMTVEQAEIGDFPLFNSDLRDETGYPEPVARVRRQLLEADGLLIASPEYNRSVSGVLKNAIDWLSTGGDSPLNRKPTAILGAGGRLGTAQSQGALRIALAHNDVQALQRPEVLVVDAWTRFDEELNLTDERISEQVRRLLFALDGQIRLHRSRPQAIVLAANDALLTGLSRLLSEAGYEATATSDAAWAAAELKSGNLALFVSESQYVEAGPIDELAATSGTTLVVADAVDGFLDQLDGIR
jgi:chromate reductase